MKFFKKLGPRLLLIDGLICGIPFVALGAVQYIGYGYFQEHGLVFISIVSILTVQMLLSVTSVLVKSRYVLNPIHELVEAMEEYDRTNELKPMAGSTFTEAEELRAALERLVTIIQERDKAILRTKKLKMMGEMSAQIAHEIRNPLTTIKGTVQLLQAQPDNRAMFDNFSPMMISELDRMNEIVEKLLNYAKPQEINFQDSSLNQLIDEIIMQNIGEVTPRNIVFDNRIQEKWIVYTDEKRLRQVILNIVRNAIEANDDGGIIVFEAKMEEGYLELAIRDTGNGFPPELISKIGTPFLTTKATGNGLGLATCMKLMDELEGYFDIHNLPIGGAEVLLKIPTNRSLIFSA